MVSLVERALSTSLFKKRRFLKELKEADFRDRAVRPLLLRQGLVGGSDICGPNEKGKDAVFCGENALGLRELWVVQTKRGSLTLSRESSKNVVEAITQLKTALATPVDLLHEGKQYPDKVILCASGKINDSALQHINNEIRDSRLLFLDCDALIERIDKHFPELWFEIDANVLPYLRLLKQAMEDYTEDIIPSSNGAHGVPSSVNENRFLMLHAHRTRLVPRRRQGQIEQVPKIDEVPITSISSRKERLVIVTGEAGSGKSTGLRRLACTLADRFMKAEPQDQIIPIFIRASFVADSPDDILTIAANETTRVASSNAPCFSQKDLSRGGVALLVDGLDEIPTDEGRTSVLRRLLEFNTKYPECQIVVSSRDYSFVTMLPELAPFTRFRLSPISLAQASQLLRHLEKSRKLPAGQSREILRRLRDVHGLTLNPLLVTVFAATTDYSKKDVPANITELFKKYTELMLGRWDATKGLGQQYQSVLKDFLLRQVAYEMHRRQAASLQRTEFGEIVQSQLTKLGHEIDLDKLLEEMLDRSDLFRTSDETIEFRHHLLQEFFAGRGIPSRQILESHVSDEWWQRAVVFYFGEHPEDKDALDSAVASVRSGSTQEQFRAAVTIGLAIQACYLVDVSERIDVLKWVVQVLAKSKKPFVDAVVENGVPPLIAFVWYYLFGRDSVACSVPRAKRPELSTSIDANSTDPDDADTKRFWLIVGALESNDLQEAEKLSRDFNPADDRLALGVHLGAFMIQNLRATSPADRKLAEKIGKQFQDRLRGLRQRLVDEYKTELIEMHNGRVRAITNPS